MFSKTGCSYITVNLTVSTDWSKGLSQHGCQPKIFPKVKEKENSKHPIQNKHGSPKRMLPSSLSILSRHTWLGRLVGGSILMEGSHSPGGSTVTCVKHIIIHCWQTMIFSSSSSSTDQTIKFVQTRWNDTGSWSHQVQELVESGNEMISVVRLVGHLVEHLQSSPHSKS